MRPPIDACCITTGTLNTVDAVPAYRASLGTMQSEGQFGAPYEGAHDVHAIICFCNASKGN